MKWLIPEVWGGGGYNGQGDEEEMKDGREGARM